MALGEDAQGAVELAHDPGHGGLAGARVAGEDQMEAHVRALHPPLLAQLPDLHQIHQTVYVLFHHLQADELIQLRHGLLQSGPRLLLGRVLGGRRGGGPAVLGSGVSAQGQGGEGIAGGSLRVGRLILRRRTEEVVEKSPGPVTADHLVKFVHQLIQILDRVPAGGEGGRTGEVLVRPRGGGDGRHVLLVAHRRQLAVEQGDAPALGEGEGAVVGGAEHQEVLLDLGEIAAVAGAGRPVRLGKAAEEVRHAHGVVGVGLVVGHGPAELLGSEADLPVRVDLVDARHIPAPAPGRGPQAEGAGPEVGVDLLAGDAGPGRDALTEVAHAVGVVPVKIFAHMRPPFVCGIDSPHYTREGPGWKDLGQKL